MKLLAVVDEQVHQDALGAARRIGTVQTVSQTGLNTVQVDEVMAWVTRLWDPIEEAIVMAYRQGMAAARPIVEQLHTELTALANNVSARARDVQAILSERLNTYLMRAIDGALGRVRDHITVGAKQFTINSVKVDQKVSVSSSLKMSLSEICEFVAEGEIALSAEYALV